MDPGTTLSKTEKGRLEMAGRSGALTAVQRRLLILVDGKKPVNDLGAFVRIGELEAALEHLLAQGYIAAMGEVVPLPPPAGPGFVSPSPVQAVRAANSPQEFARVREEASRFVRERLGSVAAPICAAIDRSSSPHELRAVLRGFEVFAGQPLDRETTQVFARHFGAMLL